MSWYKKNNPDIMKDEEDRAGNATPKKPSYIQVPSSSPINVKSSPNQQSAAIIPTSMKPTIDEAKERQLEAKRQAIRQHKDFPIIRKRFHYLKESDIFKGFVKGKGNLREITQWLSDNFNEHDILHREQLEKKRRIEEEARIKQKTLEDRMKREYEERQAYIRKQKQLKNDFDEDDDLEEDDDNDISEDEDVMSDEPHDDEDQSPVKIKVRGRAKVKHDSSPVKPEGQDNIISTKVTTNKPKISILDKYKFKPKVQTTLDVFGGSGEPIIKKRKLVRGSALEDITPSASPPPIIPPKYDSPMIIPKLSAVTYEAHLNSKKTDRNEYAQDDDINEMIVSDDDLDRLEEKIKENKKAAKLKKSEAVIAISDDELEEDDVSDDMSEEDDEANYNGGLTTIDAQILEFINNASVQDLIEICVIEPPIAEFVASQRPFETIYDVSENPFILPDEDDKTKKAKNNRKKKTIGLRIVENTEHSLKGYKAVDSLIKTCSQYGESISNQMKSWGVKVTGEGELDLVELDPLNEGEVNEVIDLDNEEEEESKTNDKDKDYGNEDEEDVVITHHKKKGLRYIKHKPSLLADDITLNNYQQVGVNWLNLLYQNKLSCILADEMGLGKTCQVISFMAHLKETEKKKGPHLVVVPASTIENWLREFNKFCPDLKVQAYYGSVREREDLRYELQDTDFDVLVTTYTLASGSSIDFKFLKSQNFNIIVYDEGHLLKNSNTERYNRLMRLQGKFRLLLTGTPLQNNLRELVSLLAFIQKLNATVTSTSTGNSSAASTPNNYNPLLSVQAISKAKTMMTPFVLRRRKNQVLQHLPAKCHEIIKCDLTELQDKVYHDYLSKARFTKQERERRKLLSSKEQSELARTKPIESSTNTLMSLRKISLHPLLFRLEYDDAKLKKMAKAIMREPEYLEANETFIFEDMQVMNDYELNNLCQKFPYSLKTYKLEDEKFLNSGKVIQLNKLLKTIIDKGEKVLIFSLFTQMLDILERTLTLSKYKFVRLDGATSVETRQDIIDQFYDDDTIPVFLLSTKAGGFGINLVAANNVIIFDQSFNPHDDKQAEDRAHRVGQTKEVTVYKLIVNKTIEENMLQLAENKLQLDETISTESNGESKFEEKTASLFENLLFQQDRI
ncbi:helicase of the Snf2/Rad54 family [Scheffersomyces coipomensis]|uniref:helicase of the Snf2/Rad54 family n=1 Tax=Scheffersomyces coipomensis TaxID=1788519 RepID=UPI00315C7F8C